MFLVARGGKGVQARFCPTVRTVVFPCKLLYEFLVLIELLEIITGHGIGAMVLCAVDVMLITEDTGKRENSQRYCSKEG